MAELAALADGSLAPERRAVLEARVAASSELADRLVEQQRAVALAESAVNGVEAPAALRARIDAQRRVRRVWVPRRLVLIGAPAIAVLAVAIGVVVFGSGASSERFHATLAATGQVPGGAGDAHQVSLRLRMNSMHGTPRLAGGRFFEAWLVTPLVCSFRWTFNEGRSARSGRACRRSSLRR